MLHDWSIDSRIFDRLVCDTNSEAFPIRQRVRWITERTSVAGTVIPVSSSKPSSRRSCQAEVRGRMQAKIAVWTFASSVSRSLGNFFPKNSEMYLSTFGAIVTSKSGLGCSLKRASRSSLGRQCLRCRSKYFWIVLGTFVVPSFDLTREDGSKFSVPDELSASDSVSFLLRLLLLPGSESAFRFLLRGTSVDFPLPDRLLWCDDPVPVNCYY